MCWRYFPSRRRISFFLNSFAFPSRLFLSFLFFLHRSSLFPSIRMWWDFQRRRQPLGPARPFAPRKRRVSFPDHSHTKGWLKSEMVKRDGDEGKEEYVYTHIYIFSYVSGNITYSVWFYFSVNWPALSSPGWKEWFFVLRRKHIAPISWRINLISRMHLNLFKESYNRQHMTESCYIDYSGEYWNYLSSSLSRLHKKFYHGVPLHSVMISASRDAYRHNAIVTRGWSPAGNFSLWNWIRGLKAECINFHFSNGARIIPDINSPRLSRGGRERTHT